MYKKAALNVASAFLAITVSVLVFERVFFTDDDPEPTTRPRAASPEWYWNAARFWTFNDNGRRTQLATADEVRYFSENDTAYLSNPHLTSYSEKDSPPWHSRADFGQLKEDYDVMDLYQNVNIRKGDGEVNIDTERLVLIRSKNMAETDQPVSIVGERTRTDAIGMRAWLDQEKVELLAKVRTVHEPK